MSLHFADEKMRNRIHLLSYCHLTTEWLDLNPWLQCYCGDFILSTTRESTLRVSSQVGWDRIHVKRVSCCLSLADVTSSHHMGLTPVVYQDYGLQRLWDVCNSQPINLALSSYLRKCLGLWGMRVRLLSRSTFIYERGEQFTSFSVLIIIGSNCFSSS